MQHEVLFLPIVFSISIAIALIFYTIGGRISAKGKASEGKISPYSCGEDLPYEGDMRINLEKFFLFTVYFLIFDVIAFTMVISFGVSPLYAYIYALVTLASVVFIMKR